ncbi:hypothetical protein GOP47_0006561 [Adiantum capillus-veneris]|uniref:Lysosomal Pro-X carboxypeptidase n=1 Tax=Adiantum capillus-veneris TaxID=13818 RepID=A0A9D4V3N8_ADICA|nr:hypothetical protein GOP47_0006561 [Adiantum capillus-veneris]
MASLVANGCLNAGLGLLFIALVANHAAAWSLGRLSTRLLSHPHRLRPASLATADTYDIRYFTQLVDHFAYHPHPSTFQQRYLISTEHCSEPNSPIFMYCGNEGKIEWFAQNTGFLWELASTFGALVLFPEHRYYGESMPFGSQEAAYKDADSLAYLTSEQALADFVSLLTDLKKNMSAEACPVVLFGGSYGGMLAAWMRLKYPHIAIGAIASSAPILQFEDLVPTDTFYRIVSEDFKGESSDCFDVIQQSWDVLDTVGQSEEGLQSLTNKFLLCSQLNNTSELENWMYAAYEYLAMVNYPYAANFTMPLPAFPVREVCNAINAGYNNTDILSRIFAGMSVYYNYTGSATCFDLGENIDGIDGWDWQACTEMVMPMSSNGSNSMFPPYTFDLQQYEAYCLEQYGVKPMPTWITQEFGGHSIKKVLENFGSNIVFSNGLLDPWSGGGVLQNISSTLVAVITEQGAHHLDLRSSTEDDPQWLIEQRQVEIAHIKSWLSQYQDQHHGYAASS